LVLHTTAFFSWHGFCSFSKIVQKNDDFTADYFKMRIFAAQKKNHFKQLTN